MRKKLPLSLALVAFVGLAACGDTFGERAIIGAGAGAATAVVLQGNPVAGAIIGSAANVLYCKENRHRC